jgi:hypothetical protein
VLVTVRAAEHPGDKSIIIGIIVALFLTGPGFVYGGYACKPEQRYSAWLLYCYGGGCFGAAIALTAMVASGWIVKASESLERISQTSSAQSDESGFGDQNKEAVGEQPSTAVPVPSPAAARVFVTVTASYLWHLRDRHTSAETQRLVAPYVGKWLKYSATVRDVTADGLLVFKGGVVFCRFSEEHLIKSIITLPSRTRISAAGRINSIDQFGIYLENCELLN